MAGNVPIKDTLVLTRGSDFVARYMVTDGKPDIPDGTTARIEITDTSDTDSTIIATWDATTVDARYLEFRTESEETDLIEDRTRYRLLVSFPDTPTLDLCWYYGPIQRKQ